MKYEIKTKKFDIPLKIDTKAAKEHGIDIKKIFVIYAGISTRGIASSIIETAENTGKNILAIALKDSIVSGPSIDNILCILKAINK